MQKNKNYSYIALLLVMILVFSLTCCNKATLDNSSNSQSNSITESKSTSESVSASTGTGNEVQAKKLVCDAYENVSYEVTNDHRYVVNIARNQPLLEANLGYKCVKIAVNQGERYLLDLAIQSAKSYGIILTDENNFVKEQKFRGENDYLEINSLQITIPEGISFIFINTRIPKEISVKKIVQVEKDEKDIVQLDENLLIGCANCGKFSYTDGITDVNSYINQWKGMLNERDYDLFSFEDVSNNFSTGITANSVISQGKTVYNVDGFSDCLRITSEFIPETVTIVAFKDRMSASSKNTARYYAIRLTYHVKGRSLAVYGLHLVAEGHISAEIEQDGTSASQKLRQVQFQGLIDDAKFYDESIFIGDFNAQSSVEYEIFKTNGYSMVNCGDYGEFATLRDIPADNIIVSSGFEINSIRLLSDYNLNTDHTALSVSLTLK